MEKPTDKETAKYNAVSSIADLLRESTKKDVMLDNDFTPETVYSNSIFSNEEHETVKRAFLRLCEEL